jgi:hypothetical protein
MNRLSKSLLVGLLEQENYITGFYGGGFKPPTKGHFAVVKKSLEQFPDIDKFYIIIGKGIRNGISQDESYSVWNIYKKYLGDKVEIVKADSSPLKHVKDYIKENTDHKSLVFIGSRDGNDEDAQDFVKRKEFFDKYGDHVEVKNITTTGGVSGTKAREAAKISKEQFFQFIPKELTDEEKNLIFTYVQTVIQENAIKKVASRAKELSKNFTKAFKDQKGDFKGFGPLVIKYLKNQDLTSKEKEKLKQNFTDILKTSGVAITFPILGASGNVLLGWLTNKLTKGKFTTLPSKFKNQLLDHQIIETLSGINLSQSLNENASYSKDIDIKEKILELTKHMLAKGMNIQPLPKVKFINGDSENAREFLGKTAYYNPEIQTIVLYTEGRHPKDIVRSFSHEMIHHIQNLEDRLGDVSTSNTMEDDNIDKLEQEANLKGTMTFRNWTDSLNEGISPFSKKNEEYILSDIKEYGDILEFKIDLEDTYQYSFNSNVGEFYDDVNNVRIIVKLKPTTKNIPEFKFYSLQNGKQLSFNKLKHYNPKIMNTIFKIFMNEVLPQNSKILIQPFDYLRYRLFRAMLNNNLDGNQYKIDTKDDPIGQSILLVQKLNESKKPYKHKHGFDNKLGKDPFGLNQFAREIMQEDSLLKEGKYDTITNKISGDVFRYWKNNLDKGIITFNNSYEHEGEDIDIEATLTLTPGIKVLKVDGGADDKNDFIVIKFEIDPSFLPKFWGEISFNLKDVVRHEIEHLTHGEGFLQKPGKYMENDEFLRQMIDSKLLSKAEYFKLEKEVDANLQGMYFRAKKERRPFKNVIDTYLNTQNITSEEKEEILDLWRSRGKALSLPIFENEEKAMKYKIFLDMDGVLVDFDQQFKDITGQYPKDYEATHTIEEFWDEIDNAGVGFWRGMKWMPGGEALYNRTSQFDHVLLSSPSRSEVSKIGKHLWRRDKTPNTKLILSRSHLKKNYAAPNHILIDDRESNIKQWRDAGGIGILYKSAEQVNKELDKLSL